MILALSAFIAAFYIGAHLLRRRRWLRERKRVKDARALARMGAHVSLVSTYRGGNVTALYPRGSEPPRAA